VKTIIAGSRGINQYNSVVHAVRASGFVLTEIVSGAARGVDALGEQYGAAHAIPVRRFPAAWHSYGPRAGRLRNSQMATYADQLIAVWDGASPGTRHMIEAVRTLGKPVFVWETQA
jgi:hypothetical protein